MGSDQQGKRQPRHVIKSRIWVRIQFRRIEHHDFVIQGENFGYQLHVYHSFQYVRILWYIKGASRVGSSFQQILLPKLCFISFHVHTSILHHEHLPSGMLYHHLMLASSHFSTSHNFELVNFYFPRHLPSPEIDPHNVAGIRLNFGPLFHLSF